MTTDEVSTGVETAVEVSTTVEVSWTVEVSTGPYVCWGRATARDRPTRPMREVEKCIFDL